MSSDVTFEIVFHEACKVGHVEGVSGFLEWSIMTPEILSKGLSRALERHKVDVVMVILNNTKFPRETYINEDHIYEACMFHYYTTPVEILKILLPYGLHSIEMPICLGELIKKKHHEGINLFLENHVIPDAYCMFWACMSGDEELMDKISSLTTNVRLNDRDIFDDCDHCVFWQIFNGNDPYCIPNLKHMFVRMEVPMTMIVDGQEIARHYENMDLDEIVDIVQDYAQNVYPYHRMWHL